jgi:outer membrane protein assembly factor BamB
MTRYAALILIGPALVAEADDWPQFRGPDGDGRSSEANLPLTWSEQQNIRWKTAIPGRGWSSPVVVDGELWLTTATDGNRSLRLISVDAATGRIQKDVEVFRLTDAVAGHEKNSAASPTPIVEGDRVYVHFGSYGTACVKRDGKLLWRTQELKFAQVHGPAGSPVLYENLLIVNCDGHDKQFVAALDKNTGAIAWQSPRPSAMAYATPLVIRTPKNVQVVSPGAHRAVSYNPATGEELWSVSYGDGFSNVPRPVFAHGLTYLTTGFYNPKLLAVRPDGKGNVSATHVAWRYERGVPLTPSPVVAGEYLYMISDNGIATCLNALTGEEIWRQRLTGSYSASPVFADGKVWFLSEEGETHVVAVGKDFRKLAVNKLDGRFLASMAISSGALFLRSDAHLYRIGAQK